MGWLRKKGRQLDKRVRKIFGKNAWLKVAALIGVGYVGMAGVSAAASAVPGTVLTTGAKIKAFASGVFNTAKGFFWNPATTTAGVTTPGSSTILGKAAGNVAVNVATGVAQTKLTEEDPYGRQAGYAPQENSGVGNALAASQAAYGSQINIMDAYRNFDFGTGSTTMLLNTAPRNIQSYRSNIA